MTTHLQSNSSDASRFSVERTDAGWEIREYLGAEFVRSRQLTDWHRVERSMREMAGPDATFGLTTTTARTTGRSAQD